MTTGGFLETYIYGEGAKARAGNIGIEACPYPEGILARKWRAGWKFVNDCKRELFEGEE